MKIFLAIICVFFGCIFIAAVPSGSQDFLAEYLISSERKNGWSEIAYAVEKDNEEIALWLLPRLKQKDLTYSIKEEIRYRNGKRKETVQFTTVLGTAIRRNQIRLVKSILEMYPEVISFKEYTQEHLLGTRPEIRNEKTMPMIAILETAESLPAFKLIARVIGERQLPELISQLKPTTRSSGSYLSPLEYALQKGKVEEAECLLSLSEFGIYHEISFHSLSYAIRDKRYDLLKKLLDHHFESSTSNEVFEVALIAAVNHKDIEAVQCLINYGARPTLKVFELAIQNNVSEIVDLLTDLID